MHTKFISTCEKKKSMEDNLFVLCCFYFVVLYVLTLVLLNPDIPCFANSVDPDQLASSEAN